MIIDVRHRSPTHHQPPMILSLSLSLSIPSHPLLRLPIASCARARATHVSAAFIFSTYFYTRLLGHGSQRVGVAPSRVVPSRITEFPRPRHFPFLNRPPRTDPRDATCNPRAIFRSSSIHLPHGTPLPLFLSSLLKPALHTKHPRIGGKWIHTFFSPRRKHRDSYSNNELYYPNY